MVFLFDVFRNINFIYGVKFVGGCVGGSGVGGSGSHPQSAMQNLNEHETHERLLQMKIYPKNVPLESGAG